MQQTEMETTNNDAGRARRIMPFSSPTRFPQVSTLEIAPTILKNFAVPVPSYMATPTNF
jgi:hypothetical protein